MRTVIEEESVSSVIDKEQELHPRLGEAFDALKWWLSHRPETGELLDDINWLYKQEGDRIAKIPSLIVVYTFDHQCVILKFILVRVPTVNR
jgi:hypothetical protein